MKDKNKFVQVCKERATMDEYIEKVQEAKEIIREALKEAGKKLVSFSGGKDSTCVLHLVLQEDSEVLVFHWDYGRYFIPREIHNEIIENAIKLGAKNIRIETSYKYEVYKRNAKNVLGADLIGRLLPQLYKEGYRIDFLGLRKEEAIKRKLRLNTNKNLSLLKEVNPIQNWSWLDVWTYIFSNNLPYLRFYDIYGQAVGYENVRFVTLFDNEFEKFGSPNLDGVLYWKFRHI